MAWLRSRLGTSIWRWRRVPIALNAIKLGYEFVSGGWLIVATSVAAAGAFALWALTKFWPFAVLCGVAVWLSALWAKYLHGARVLASTAGSTQIPLETPPKPRVALEAELRAKDEIGESIEQQLLPTLQQRGAIGGKLVAAANGHIQSLDANLERRGASETLLILDELRQNAANAFDTVTGKFASNRRYQSLASEERTYLDVRQAWWTAFNSTLGAVRDLPQGLNRHQICRFIQSDLARWSHANAEAIVWAERFVRRLREGVL